MKEVKAPEKTDTDLAVEVWYGVHGSNDSRKKSLGNRYDQVQKSVEEIGKSVPNFITASKAYMKKFGHESLI